MRSRHVCEWFAARTMDTQWRHKSKISEKLGWCGRQNMLRPYLKSWEWEWIFGRAVKAIFSLGVRSPWFAVQIILLHYKIFFLAPKTMCKIKSSTSYLSTTKLKLNTSYSNEPRMLNDEMSSLRIIFPKQSQMFRYSEKATIDSWI